jgi:hypothetical protein
MITEKDARSDSWIGHTMKQFHRRAGRHGFASAHDDRDTPLVRDRTARLLELIWVYSEAEFF